MTALTAKKKTSQKRDIVFPICNGIFLCILMLVTLYPVLNTVAVSLNDGVDAVRGGIGLQIGRASCRERVSPRV